MALKSTIFKVRLNVSDLDRNVYEDFSLSVARHPSENDARMMLRIAVFALHADRELSFGRGISSADEPDIWLKDLTGQSLKWIELGTPDPDRLRKACAKSEEVLLYTYGERSLTVWWQKHRDVLARFENLHIYTVSDAQYRELEGLVTPAIDLQATVSGGDLWLNEGSGAAAEFTPTPLRNNE